MKKIRLAFRLVTLLLLQSAAAPAAPIAQLGGGNYITGSYFLEADGTLWTVGYINSIGFNNTYSQIVASNITAAAQFPYNDHTLLIKTDGSLWAYGDNSYGQLGDGTTTATNIPEQIVASNVTAVAVGQYFSLFLKSDGSLWAMGDNREGQLGDGTTTSRSKPEKIVPNGVTAVAAGVSHSLFLKSDGSLWAMGWNRDGELGDGTSANSIFPEQIISSNVTLIAAEENDSLFIKSDGSLWAMGDNWAGQLGDGTTTSTHEGGTINRAGPVQIVASGIKAIAGGANSSTFLKADGSLWAMGLDSYNGNCFTLTPQQVYPLILMNGNFDSGNFLGWTNSGNFNSCTIDTNALYARLGIYGAELGPNGALGYLAQAVPTTPGGSYLLSFWLDSPDGGNPNEFQVSWNGATLLDLKNIPAIGWTNIQLLLSATETNTVLQFGFRDDATWLGLDDIRVVPAEPDIATLGLAGETVVLNAANGLAGRTYHTLMSSDAFQPLGQWAPVATNVPGTDGNFVVTNAMNIAAPHGFYRLKLVP
jgi:alpha-tubulin suppressor-like RCC1 family protein